MKHEVRSTYRYLLRSNSNSNIFRFGPKEWIEWNMNSLINRNRIYTFDVDKEIAFYSSIKVVK